jgi:hypothetical protein
VRRLPVDQRYFRRVGVGDIVHVPLPPAVNNRTFEITEQPPGCLPAIVTDVWLKADGRAALDLVVPTGWRSGTERVAEFQYVEPLSDPPQKARAFAGPQSWHLPTAGCHGRYSRTSALVVARREDDDGPAAVRVIAPRMEVAKEPDGPGGHVEVVRADASHPDREG